MNRPCNLPWTFYSEQRSLYRYVNAKCRPRITHLAMHQVTRYVARRLCRLISTLLLIVSTQGNAHEVWIEPLDFTPEAGTDFVADTRIGDKFKGSAQYYVQENTITSGVVAPGATLKLDRISGDIPAIKAAVKTDGLHVAWMHTKPDRLQYHSFNKFKGFVTKQGSPHIAEQHIKNGWPDQGFYEAYSRCSKSLIQVGTQSIGMDKAIGMPIELVAMANPYQLKSDAPLPVQLLWQSEPIGNAQVMVFHKTTPKEVAINTVRTNDQGVAMIDLKPGTYLLNAVHIIAWDGEPEVLWHSYWASLTFNVADNVADKVAE